MKILNRLIIILIALLVVSCSSREVKVNNLTDDSKEGVVVGKVKVLLNDKNVTTNSVLSFKGKAWGANKLQLKNEDYFLINLPAGENNLDGIISRLSQSHRGIRYFFSEGKTTFHVDQSKINYIGDIVIKWTGPDQGPPLGIGGPFSAYRVSTTSTGHAEISTENNINNVLAFLDNKFPNGPEEVNISLLGQQVGSMEKRELIEQKDNVEKIDHPEQSEEKGQKDEREQIEAQKNKAENNIEKRLIYLKQLFEKKLITKEEYEAKRREIIDEI